LVTLFYQSFKTFLRGFVTLFVTMKKLWFLLICSFNLIAFSQEKPIIISGTITVNDIGLSDVHIINESLDIGTITNDIGNFEILAKEGNIFIISHINYEIKEYCISQEDIQNQKINLQLTNKTYELEEVVVENKKGIFHVDKDIMSHNLPIVNAKTLHLPYAESEKVKEEKLLKFQSGASVSLDGLLNVLNGSNKIKKQLEEVLLADTNLKSIRNHFTDSFFTNQLQIKKENINTFLNFNRSSGIIQLHKKRKFLQLTAILLENSKNFSHKNSEEKTALIINN